MLDEKGEYFSVKWKKRLQMNFSGGINLKKNTETPFFVSIRFNTSFSYDIGLAFVYRECQ